jgi:hypothetical protein
MGRIQSLRRFASVAGVFALLSVIACSDKSPSPSIQPADEPVDVVHTRLAEIAGDLDPTMLFYRNDKQVEAIERQLASGGRPFDIRLRMQYAVQLLRAGDPARALEELTEVEEVLAGTENFTEKNRLTLLRLRGLLNLRLGEQENCIDNHTIDSCLLPIRGAGVHTRQRGSRAAFSTYLELLEQYPEDLSFRWLLNIAAMTLGEYPDGVPARWRVPPEVFESEYPLPRFVDAAATAGVGPRTLSGGAAIDDFNGDGRLDIIASSWGVADQLRHFENLGDGTFVDRSETSGLLGELGGLNLNHADFDNDGDIDLYVMRGGWLARQGEHPNSLLRNRGDGTFENVTVAAGVYSEHPSQNSAWGDYDNDGLLDLFVGHESRGQSRPCHLFHNNGDGTFTDTAAEVGLDHAGFVKGSVWGDYDNDGRIDLYLSQFGGANLLFHNEGSPDGAAWRFTEVAEAAGVALPLKSFSTWFFDYDNDGFLDLLVTSFADFGGDALDSVVSMYLGLPHETTRTKLYRNLGDGTFEDVSQASGVERVLLTMGANFGDIDNDGWLDAYFGTGEPAMGTLVPNVMLRNDAGQRFQDVTTAGGFGSVQKGHGIAFGDIDSDGDQDIYAVMGGAYSGDTYQNILFKNPGNENHWITLRLQGERANRSAIGARVRVVVVGEDGSEFVIHRVVGTGGSFGSSSLQLEVGIGRARSIDRVEVSWPGSGPTTTYRDLPMDRTVAIREGIADVQLLDVTPLPLGRATPSHEHHAQAP